MSDHAAGHQAQTNPADHAAAIDGQTHLLTALTHRASAIIDAAHGGSPLEDPSADDPTIAPEATARILETLVAFAGDMLLVVSPQGTIQFASPSVKRFLGHEPRQLVGEDVLSFIAADDLPRVVALFADALEGESTSIVHQTAITTATGERRWVEAITIDLVDDPAVGGFVVTLRDVNDRVIAEQAAVHERQRFEDLVDSLPDVIVRLDKDLRPTFGNAAARAIDSAWLEGIAASPAAFEAHDDSTTHVSRELELVLSAGETRSFETPIATRSGEIWLSSMAMPERDAAGEVTGILIVTRDITVHRARTEELTRRALEDPLTGLANRAHLEAEIERAVYSSTESGTPIGIIFIDLDGFKKVNDVHGHAIGDRLLQTFARRARDTLRPSDLIARLGGDEFVVLPNHLHIAAEVETLADRLHQTVHNPFEIEGRSVSISLSIGIATASARAGLSGSELLNRADQAMYASKRRGRNRSTVWTPSLATRSSRRP